MMKKILAVVAIVCVLGWSWSVIREPRPVQAQQNFCNQTIAINVAAAATQTIIGGVNGTTVRVCAFVISGDTLATTAQFVSGTTNLTGAMRLCDECNISSGSGMAVILSGVANSNLQITAATGAVTGFINLGQN